MFECEDLKFVVQLVNKNETDNSQNITIRELEITEYKVFFEVFFYLLIIRINFLFNSSTEVQVK